MHNKTECVDFIQQLKSDQHQKIYEKSSVSYISKTNTHRGNGIGIIDKKEEILLQEKYGQDGEFCVNY